MHAGLLCTRFLDLKQEKALFETPHAGVAGAAELKASYTSSLRPLTLVAKGLIH